MTAVAEATIGHNSAAVGEILNEKPETLFTEKGMLPLLLESIEKEISDLRPDTSTEKGRAAIKSLAYSIATRKNAFDKAGKKLNEDLRKSINVVDKLRAKVWDELEALQAKARKPYDEWETVENAKKDKINAVRTLIMEASHIPADASLRSLSGVRGEIVALEIDAALFGDLAAPTEAERSKVIENLDAAMARIEKAEADRIELERLRTEKAEAERKAAEAAAAEAKKKADDEHIAAAAKRAAEEAVEAERKKAQEAAAAVERERAAEQAKRDAEAAAERRKAQEAEAAREAAAAAERKKAQDAIDEANRKAKAAEEALEADRRAEAAKVAEAARVKAANDAAEAARQRDQKHRSDFMRAAKEAFMEHGKIDEEGARLIVLAIVAGSIPNVTLRF